MEMNEEVQRLTKKVIIIGAGLAGLTCAQSLVDKGVAVDDICVLEARDRTGGRVYSHEFAGMMLDNGAAWIHGVTNNPLASALKDAGVQLKHVSNSNPWMCPWSMGLGIFFDGVRMQDARRDDMMQVFKAIMDSVAEDRSDARFDEALLRAQRALPYSLSHVDKALIYTNVYLIEVWMGGSVRELQAAEFQSQSESQAETRLEESDAEDLWGDYPGAHCLPIGGMGQVLGLIASSEMLACVRLNSPVTEISYTQPHARAHSHTPTHDVTARVTVKCETGPQVEGEVVVVTVPLGVLQTTDITFEPPLSQEKRDAIQRSKMGRYKKVMMQFQEAFWPSDDSFLMLGKDGACSAFENIFLEKFETAPSLEGTAAVPDLGPIVLFDNYWCCKGIPVLEAVCPGEQGDLLYGLGDDVIVQALMVYVRANFSAAEDKYPTRVCVTRWEEDRFSRGSYSFLPFGAKPTDFAVLAEPVGNVLYFAGEGTSEHYQGCVGGGHDTGLRVAEALVRDLPSLIR